MSLVINKSLMSLSKRSEKAAPDQLVQSFVDVGPLFTLLSNQDHQIIYGRRGTGKTHALIYLREEETKSGNLCIYIDLSNLGSTGGLYADQGIPLTQRATRLLSDTLSAMHEDLFQTFVDNSEKFDLSKAGPILDTLAEESTKVVIKGVTTSESEMDSARENKTSSGLDASVSQTELKIGFTTSGSRTESIGEKVKYSQTGTTQYSIHFGTVKRTIEKLIELIKGKRLILLLDEWSSIPMELQPYLADMFRRCLFPIQRCTVKIAAIEFRSQFQLPMVKGDYIGIEVGADISADTNLDDFMVFDNDPLSSRKFFGNLFLRHLSGSEILKKQGISFSTSSDFIQKSFTQINTFEELIRASEGVPRDAINILSLAAQYALEEKIGIDNIRKASRNWYQSGKEAPINSRDLVSRLFSWLKEKVIKEKKARGFLLKSGRRHQIIDELFDARLLHILKKNISSKYDPGVKYDAYKLDYGCYVDLISTVHETKGLFKDDELKFSDVPPDDWRSLRNSILDIDEFNAAIGNK